jgi:hypothetical protein
MESIKPVQSTDELFARPVTAAEHHLLEFADDLIDVFDRRRFLKRAAKATMMAGLGAIGAGALFPTIAFASCGISCDGNDQCYYDNSACCRDQGQCGTMQNPIYAYHCCDSCTGLCGWYCSVAGVHPCSGVHFCWSQAC